MPLLEPNVFFFSYVNEMFETSETKKERVLQLRNRRPNHYPFTSSELSFSLSEISQCEPSVLKETISGQKYSH